MNSAGSAAARSSEQRALDAQFTLDSIIDLSSLKARREAAATSAAARFKVIRGVKYGDAPDETLDFYPAAAASAPVQIFIHGGFWSSMRAAEFSFIADGFVPFGASLMIIDYPLIPNARMAAIVESCRRAVAWAFRSGAAHGIDFNRIHVSGNSAGGHLVAEVMDRRWMRDAGLPADVIKGGCAISGLFDLATVASSFRNEQLQLTEDEVDQFSPQRRAIDIGAPLIVAVGGEETEEFLRQSSDFAAKCDAVARGVEHAVVDGANHISVVLDAFANPSTALNQTVRRQMQLQD